MMDETLPPVILSAKEMRIGYRRHGKVTPVLDGIELILRQGEIVALLGESGSGKSTIGKALTGLLPSSAVITGGTLHLQRVEAGKALREEIALQASPRIWQQIRGRRIAMLFQDARLALNPLMTVGQHFRELLLHHRLAANRDEALALAQPALERLGFADPRALLAQYPFELSGGMCQRVCLALGVVMQAEVWITDEPTSALDVHNQAEVLRMLRQLQQESALTVLLITHDLGVARAISDRVVVLHQGRIVEHGNCSDVLEQPQHPYTQDLLRARPVLRYVPDRLANAEEGKQPVAAHSTAAHATAQDGSVLLEAVEVNKDYDKRVLHQINLRLHRSERLGILGASGSGKSTLLRCLAGLEMPDGGTVQYAEEMVNHGRDWGARRRRAYARHVQLIFQDARASLNPGQTALQLVAEPLYDLRVGPRSNRWSAAEHMLRQVGIDGDLQQRLPGELSTGQCQRVAIARALVLEPQVLLCDEAVSALDMRVQAQIIDLLLDLQQRNRFALIMISHDVRVLQTLCEQVAVMHDGRLIEQCRSDALFASGQMATRRLVEGAMQMEQRQS